MKLILTILVSAFVFGAATVAEARCYTNGQPVADGTRIGPTKCVNGKWVFSP